MKRAKQATRKRDESDDNSPWAKAKEPERTWPEHMEGKGDGDFLSYSLASRFDKGALLAHSKFGRGVVVHVEGTRVEVLFEDGVRKLGHTV